ncbi:MAG: twin-arginine translocase TatA/TatE family subunit [Actinomycetota bacterium]
MFNIGSQELLLILLVALVIVGPKRLPELTRTIGRGLREFRKAQGEVKKAVRLGLDETEPTTPGGARATKAAGAAGSPDGSSTAAPAPSEEGASLPTPDDAAEVARSLGRGLAEIRRARREIQRTFRVDLTDGPSTTPSRPMTSAPAPAPAPAPGPSAPEPPAPAAPTSEGSTPSSSEPDPRPAETGTSE